MLNQKTFQNRLAKANINLKNEKILIGFSGGSDSVALCHLLTKLQEKLDFSLELLYIQHNLRGEESRAEEAFVQKLAQQMQLPLTIVSVDVKRKAKNDKISIETAARELRRQAMLTQLNKRGFTKIALAHHKQDQAETVLMHFLRGSGVFGLVGMQASSQNIIRPLLPFDKSEIVDYLKAHKLKWVDDSSNQNLSYRRNRVRNSLIPYLQIHFNQNIIGTLADTAEQMQDLKDYLTGEIDRAYSDCACTVQNSPAMHIPSLQKLAPYLRQMTIRKAIEQIKGNAVNLEKNHIRRALSLLDKQTGKQENLLEGLAVKRSYEYLIFFCQEQANMPKDYNFSTDNLPLSLDISDRKRYINVIGECVFESRILLDQPEKTEQTDTKQNFDWDKLQPLANSLTLRYPLPEDYIIINQSGNTKKLKDFLSDQKVIREKRGSIPVVANQHEIIWVVGHRIAYPYRITDQTKNIIQFSFQGRTDSCQTSEKEYQERQ